MSIHRCKAAGVTFRKRTNSSSFSKGNQETYFLQFFFCRSHCNHDIFAKTLQNVTNKIVVETLFIRAYVKPVCETRRDQFVWAIMFIEMHLQFFFFLTNVAVYVYEIYT